MQIDKFGSCRDYLVSSKDPLWEDGAIEGRAFSLEVGQGHLVLCDLRVDEASQCRNLAGEELHGTSGNIIPVTDIGIQEVSSTAHHVAHTGLLDVLRVHKHWIKT